MLLCASGKHMQAGRRYSQRTPRIAASRVMLAPPAGNVHSSCLPAAVPRAGVEVIILDGGATTLRRCRPPGYAKSQPGQYRCVRCTPGSISSSPGALHCTVCPYGSTPNAARTGCGAPPVKPLRAQVPSSACEQTVSVCTQLTQVALQLPTQNVRSVCMAFSVDVIGSQLWRCCMQCGNPTGRSTRRPRGPPTRPRRRCLRRCSPRPCQLPSRRRARLLPRRLHRPCRPRRRHPRPSLPRRRLPPRNLLRRRRCHPRPRHLRHRPLPRRPRRRRPLCRCLDDQPGSVQECDVACCSISPASEWHPEVGAEVANAPQRGIQYRRFAGHRHSPQADTAVRKDAANSVLSCSVPDKLHHRLHVRRGSMRHHLRQSEPLDIDV